jgi:hypothetical protein
LMDGGALSSNKKALTIWNIPLTVMGKNL